MDVLIDQPHLIDTLRYRIQAQKALFQEDLRISTEVVALVRAAERDQAALERRIREALAAFIPAQWTFSRLRRDGDAGYERVSLVAAARVPAAENYDLAERARRASGEGLTISKPGADYALPRERLDAVFDELRLEILRRAAAHAAEISAATQRHWRLGDVAFGSEAGPLGRVATAKGMYRDDEGTSFSSFDEEPERAVSGTERVSLVASVVLKSAVPGPRGSGAYVIDQ
jgi:hypothetical protein